MEDLSKCISWFNVYTFSNEKQNKSLKAQDDCNLYQEHGQSIVENFCYKMILRFILLD